MRALCMRLMHLGFDAHMAFDMTTPSVGAGDLLIVSNGRAGRDVNGTDEPGGGDGARTLVVTAQQLDGPAPQAADVVIASRADDGRRHGSPSKHAPDGHPFEWLALAFCDLLALRLRERTGQTLEEIRARHTNLE